MKLITDEDYDTLLRWAEAFHTVDTRLDKIRERYREPQQLFIFSKPATTSPSNAFNPQTRRFNVTEDTIVITASQVWKLDPVSLGSLMFDEE